MIGVYVFLNPFLGGTADGRTALDSENHHLIRGFIEIWPNFSHYSEQGFFDACKIIKIESKKIINPSAWLLNYLRQTRNKYLSHLPCPEIDGDENGTPIVCSGDQGHKGPHTWKLGDN